MKFSEFPLDRFLSEREQAMPRLQAFYECKGPRVLVSQRPGYAFTRAICRYRDRQLESELDFLADCLRYKSDLMLNALEPWVGVGIYASALGCKYIWSDYDAPQTRPIICGSDEIASLKVKPLSEWEEMKEVLERIRYFKQATGNQLGITLTDTQSPNDTASLIMDTTEFFSDSLDDPEALEPLFTKITDLIIEYSRIQMEEIGEKLFATPGHIAVSGFGPKGITLSGDNLAVLSPAAYENTERPYLERIAAAFDGVHIHSCGKYTHNVPSVLATKGVRLLDCAIDKTVDPSPNAPEKMAELLKGQEDVI